MRTKMFYLNILTSLILHPAWLLFTSAIVTDSGVRDQLIASAWTRANFNGTGGGVPAQFNNVNGNGQGGMAG